ncbi:MAG: monofunctional biosynthetic peptidoglycan transglycosylase [Bacteroidetes bacterium]|nr:MAG: monofunctional biosynthetic peptidoglycan transglycosylase [Bacteroidota bacterium]
MIKRIKNILIKIFLWFVGLSVLSVILFRFVPVPVTPLMIIRCGEQIFEGKELRLKKDWVSLNEMSAALPLAVIAAEDQNFEEHFGFDMEAIAKARKYNEKHPGKRLKGASTISQQTAKNVFLWPSRSWVRKGFEVYFTFLIELFWSKERIMEVYLNVIEMGDGIYGAEAASQKFFKKKASKLSMHESALIAAVLPNPRKWSPARPSLYIQKKSLRIVKNIGRMNFKSFND